MFENVRDSVREPSRFSNCFNYLQKMTLDQLGKSYEELYFPVEITYYSEDDSYYVTSDGIEH